MKRMIKIKTTEAKIDLRGLAAAYLGRMKDPTAGLLTLTPPEPSRTNPDIDLWR